MLFGGIYWSDELETEYTIKLNQEGPQPVSLRCIGKVIRSERLQNGHPEHTKYQIAVTLERYEFVRIERGLTAG